MSEQIFKMRRQREGGGWDELYPVTKAELIEGLENVVENYEKYPTGEKELVIEENNTNCMINITDLKSHYYVVSDINTQTCNIIPQYTSMNKNEQIVLVINTSDANMGVMFDPSYSAIGNASTAYSLPPGECVELHFRVVDSDNGIVLAYYLFVNQTF